MVTVVVDARGEAGLQDLLEALVPAAVEGLVRQVLVVAEPVTSRTAALCEQAGADLVRDFAGALALARSEVLLVVPVQMRLAQDWSARLSAHLARGGRKGRLTGASRRWMGGAPRAVLIERAAAPTDLSRLGRGWGYPKI